MLITDLHYECSRIKGNSVDERITELTELLPSTSLCAIGGFPIKRNNEGFIWCGMPLSLDNINASIKDALGFSAILTYTNKSNKSLSQLGQLCLDKGHAWAMHWINISILFASHRPHVELAFARDRRFFLSWPVESMPTGRLFVATAGIKEWQQYVSHSDDKSFDISTRRAMSESRDILKEII